MKRTVFLLVPAPNPTGPVKGACALANALAPSRRVVLAFLKPGRGLQTPLDERVEVLSLADTPGGWRGRLAAYRQHLRQAGGRAQAASLSMCFSADWLNGFCREDAVTCASVRGNLPQNYRLDYGWPGTLLAVTHLLSLHRFDHVVAMTGAMARQVRGIAGVRSKVIGNFVDEPPLESWRQRGTRQGPLRFAFVGSLTRRKQPDLIVRALASLGRDDVHLDILGEGPMRCALESAVREAGLQHRVQLHGQVAVPYPLVAAADAFVLPSRSEGVSRAALEALFLGVPCILRNVDGNAELVTTPAAGSLFDRDEDLARAMLDTATRARQAPHDATLLPPAFRQSDAAARYLALLEETA